VSARLRERRWFALALTVVVIATGGALVAALADHFAVGGGKAARPAKSAPLSPEVHQRFQQGVMMLHAKQHEHALTAFHRVLELAPDMPEAHVNMGYALLGLKRYDTARQFFEGAIALRTNQLNAYYGLAVALEGLRDLPGAIGAMRSYAHLAKADDPYKRKAEAAIWEWQAARPSAVAPITK
jgi:tetratricopeptide (TPR) repeat protein